MAVLCSVLLYNLCSVASSVCFDKVFRKKWVECPNSQSYRLMWLFKFWAHLNFSSAEKPKMLIRHSALHLPCIIRSMSRAAELVTNNKNDQYCCIIFPTKWRTQMLLFATLPLRLLSSTIYFLRSAHFCVNFDVNHLKW